MLRLLGRGEDALAQADPFAFGASWAGNARGDRAQFMDFPVNGEMVHHTMYGKLSGNVFLAIARGETVGFSENDKAIAAEQVRKGYVLRGEAGLMVNCPVLTETQYRELLRLIDPAAREIAEIALDMRAREAALLREHVPEHLLGVAENMAYFRLFECGVSVPAAQLYAERFLPEVKPGEMLPTTYVVLA